MSPPTPLSIKTSSVLRLIKEEASYHEETIQQKAAVEKLELCSLSCDRDKSSNRLS